MQKEKLEFLKEKAAELRKDVITMIYEAQSGHPGGSLSAADFVAALYFSEMKVDPEKPEMARQRPLRAVKRTRMSDTVCGACRTRIFR